MPELKFVITGTPGVGKTTAILSISDEPPVITDEVTTDELYQVKDHTTVAFDFGEVRLDEDVVVRVYGTPGQERFRHMWEILADGAFGLIILVDDSRSDPVEDMNIYIENFSDLIREKGVVVGVTRLSVGNEAALDKYYASLHQQDIFCPVMIVDPRDRDDMCVMMEALISILELV